MTYTEKDYENHIENELKESGYFSISNKLYEKILFNPK